LHITLPRFGGIKNMGDHPDMDRIEKRIELKASIDRVWRAITDYREFGIWFRVNLEGPFIAGQTTRGHITYPGYEHLVMNVVVQKIEPPKLFSFHWHPYAVEPQRDYSHEPPTLVEFRLEPIAGGTLLVISESGFDALPASRRDEAYRMNEGGWTIQSTNIETYVHDNP
jgi:uncharacterized protein YndB with AHSA1/START domain